MKTGIHKTIFCIMTWLLLLFLAPVKADTDGGWKLAKNDKDVSVYHRPVEGSDLFEFKAVKEIPARLETLASVLEDIENFPLWMSKCKHTAVVRRLGEHAYIIHFIQSLPWPVTGRDVVLKAETEIIADAGRVEVNLQSVDDETVASENGTVRMAGFRGHITLEFVSRERTRVIFSLWADPGGALPAKGVNAGTLNIPYRTLLGMEEMAAKKEYIEAGATSRAREIIEEYIRKEMGTGPLNQQPKDAG